MDRLEKGFKTMTSRGKEILEHLDDILKFNLTVMTKQELEDYPV